MVYSATDPKVLGFLGRALSLELSAAQQYLTLSHLLRLRGFPDEAKHFSGEARKEMEHADTIIERMLVLGVAPNASRLRPPALGDSLPRVVGGAQALEVEIIGFYQQAVEYCARIDDFDNQRFFARLLKEEREHAANLSELQPADAQRAPARDRRRPGE